MLRRETVVNLLLMLGISSVLILVAEIFVAPRLSNAALSRDQLLFGVMSLPGHTINEVPINSLGYTGDVPESYNPKENEIRVVTLGGSTMFLRNMTAKLKSALSERMPGREVQVIGAALPTHDSRLSVIKYDYLRTKFRSDYVVVYHGINDLWSNNVPSSDFKDDYAHVSPFHKRTWLLNNSLIARQLHKKAWYYQRERWLETGRIFHQENGAQFRSVQTFKRNLGRIVDMAREDGAVPVLMTFAWHLAEDYDKEKFLAYELGYAERGPDNCCGVDTWGTVDYVRNGLIKHNEAIKELVRETDLVVVDQYAALAGEIENFQDICHFSEIGATRFAGHVAEAIAQHHFHETAPTTLTAVRSSNNGADF